MSFVNQVPITTDFTITTPEDTKVEFQVLSSLLSSYESTSSYISSILPAYFYNESHRIIFLAIRSLHLQGKVVDIITVSNVLKETYTRGKSNLEYIGGYGYLADLTSTYVSSVGIENHIEILKNLYEKRKQQQIAYKIIEKIASSDTAIDIRTWAINQLQESAISEGEHRIISKEGIVQTFKEGVLASLNGFFIGTGLSEVDALLTHGFAPKQLSVIGGESSMGKSTLKHNIIKHILNEGGVVISFTPEQDAVMEIGRQVSIEAKIPYKYIARSRDWAKINESGTDIIPNTDKDASLLKKIKKTLIDLSKTKWFVIDNTNINLPLIRQNTMEILMANSIDSSKTPVVVFIDLLDRIQEISLAKNTSEKTIAIEQSLKFLDRMARQLQVHVCVLSQVSSKEVKKRADRRPSMGDLKGSNFYNEIANLGILVYREYIHNKDLIDDEMEIIISKQRNGDTGTVVVAFDKDTLSLSDLDTSEESMLSSI